MNLTPDELRWARVHKQFQRTVRNLDKKQKAAEWNKEGRRQQLKSLRVALKKLYEKIRGSE